MHILGNEIIQEGEKLRTTKYALHNVAILEEYSRRTGSEAVLQCVLNLRTEIEKTFTTKSKMQTTLDEFLTK